MRVKVRVRARLMVRGRGHIVVVVERVRVRVRRRWKEGAVTYHKWTPLQGYWSAHGCGYDRDR